MRRSITLVALFALVLCPSAASAQRSPPTDLDAFMARALQRRDADRKAVTDYVLDEVEAFEVLGPGRVPVARMRRKYTWYVRDGMHVRSPLEFDGVPIAEEDRQAYEERWIKTEQRRRADRTERESRRAAEGKPPALGVPSINEPRFVSQSYFLDFKFEPGNYYLAGKEMLDAQPVLEIDYLPARLFDDADEGRLEAGSDRRGGKQDASEKTTEADIDRKMNKSSQVTLWVDPASHQIVKYTFENVWLDFLPAGWIVRIDDLRASMQMGQPFPGVWLPRDLSMHAGVTLALGSMEVEYRREFSNYRKADVSSRISVPKDVR